MEKVATSFSQLIRENVHLPTALEECSDCDGLDEVWCGLVHSSLTSPQSLLATQCYVDLLLTGGEHAIAGQKLKERGLFNSLNFSTLILRDIDNFSLVQIVNLIKDDFLSLANLLDNDETVRDYVIPQSISLTKEKHHPALIDLLCWTIVEAFPKDWGQSSNVDVAQHLVSMIVTALCNEGWCCSAFDQVKDNVQQFHLNGLSTFLLKECLIVPSTETFECALGSQDKWTYSSLPPHTQQLYTLLSTYATDPLSVLCSTLACHSEINWANILSFTSAFLNSSHKAVTNFKVVLREVIERSLCEEVSVLFRCSLLMARQASLEGGHILTNYDSWFKETFKPAPTGVISKKRDLQFVMKWLTELVPHEPAYALRAHIRNPPLNFAGVRKKPVDDYVTLAKTRLSDLNEPTELPTMSHVESEKAVADVQRAMSKFSTDGCIPSYVNKMCLIRRPYYIGRFLPSLLSPSNHGNQAAESLINALEREIMIPRNLLTVYRKRSSSTDVAATDTISAVVLMDQLLERVSYGANNIVSVSQLSKLSGELTKDLVCDHSHISSSHPALPQAHVQVVDVFVHKMCKLLSQNRSTTWMTSLLAMLSRHTAFYKALFVRLRELLHNQLHLLTESHLTGLGKLCAIQWTSQVGLVQPLTFDTERELETFHCLIGHLLESRPTPCDLSTLTRVLMFAVHFIQASLVTAPQENGNSFQVAPKCFLSKLNYVYIRAGYVEGCPELTDYLRMTEQLHNYFSSHEVSYPKWICWELKIAADYLSPDQRYVYTRDQLYRRFLSQGDSVDKLLVETFTEMCEQSVNLSQGMSIIQGLSMDLPQSPQGAEPCLHTAIRVSIEKASSDDTNIEEQVLFNRIVHIVCSLPAHLLLGNTLTDPPYPLRECLLTIMTLSSDFILPLSLTIHLCRAVTDHTPLSHTPLCQSSLIAHSLMLAPLFPLILKPIHQSQHHWIHNRGPLPVTFDPLVMGVCSFCHLAGCHGNRHSLKDDIGRWAVQLNTEQREMMAVVVMDCCVRKLAAHYPIADKHFMDIAMAVLEEYPIAIVSCCSPELAFVCSHRDILDTCRREYPSNYDSVVLSLVLFHVLSDLSRTDFIKIADLRPSPLPLVLSAHSKAFDLLGRTNDMDGVADVMVEATRLAKLFVTTSPRAVVQESINYCHCSLKPWTETVC